MDNKHQGRMLLSHNFDISEDNVRQLSREEFAAVFIEGFSDRSQISCRLVNNPHWIVEIMFPHDQLSPQQIGENCAQILAAKRRSQLSNKAPVPNILILGGIKTTPAASSSPDSLQPGEWGVDVVETASTEQFLLTINWEATIAQKPIDSIFKVELKP